MSTTAETPIPLLVDAFDQFPVPSMIVDRATNQILSANRAGRELLGARPDAAHDLAGRSLAELAGIADDDLADTLRIAASGAEVSLGFCGGPSPGRRPCRVSALGKRSGRPTAWLVTVHTPKSGRAAFEHLNDQLAQANERAARERERRRVLDAEYRVLEQFSYAMAHDLKAPLRQVATILGLVEYEARSLLPAEILTHLEMARTSAQRGQDLVQALLDHASARSGPVTTEPVALDEVVAEMVAEQRLALDGVDHEVVVGPRLGTVQADPTLVRQLLDNLIGNAVKYRSTERPFRLEIRVEGGSARSPSSLVVADNGIGFEPGRATRLFEPFVRLDPGHAGGSGVGLATCRLICHRHGWRISAAGVPGRGSAFRIDFD